MTSIPPAHDPPGQVSKRAIDLVLGTVLALAALPLIIMLAIAVSLTLRTWPFFAQWRVGRGGRSIRVLKLRTLPRSAPRYADKVDIASVLAPRFTLALRRYHLDELPQLLLVPIGTMSLVGPRPEMRHLHVRFGPDFAELRTSVRPGCAGLWQISSSQGGLIHEDVRYDEFYLRHQSLRLDLWILWRAVILMVGIGGRIDLGDVPPTLLNRRGESHFARLEDQIERGIS